MAEVWKAIPGWPHYEASDHGRIKSLERVRPHNRHKGHTMVWKEKILKPGCQISGHLFVGVDNGKLMRVHRLVALAFIGPPPFVGARVLHWDDDPANNHPDNLRWGTQKDNMDDARRNGVKMGGHRPTGSRLIEGAFVCQSRS